MDALYHLTPLLIIERHRFVGQKLHKTIHLVERGAYLMSQVLGIDGLLLRLPLSLISGFLHQPVGTQQCSVLALQQHHRLTVTHPQTPYKENHHHADNNTEGEEIHLRPHLQQFVLCLQFSQGGGRGCQHIYTCQHNGQKTDFGQMETTGGEGEYHGFHISYDWEDKLCIIMLRLPERQESDKRNDTTSSQQFA